MLIFRCKVYTHKSIISIHLNIKLYRYTKQPVLIVKRAASINLLLFYWPNIICSKLITMGKPEPLNKIIRSSAVIRVIWSLKTKLIKEDAFIDAIGTLNSTLILYNNTKLPESGFPIANILYTWHLREKITIFKNTLNTSKVNPLHCISNKVMVNL